ncbi:glycoside hydrolase family 97 protein [Niabella drilacis]|uniref:Alpha-glucosidase n=1 Tax=Niabella drilacis (strain DSM 25811 / CCM 8410 / CCUG 62505 / LMG 26954 / E90) TaxID=1285928 RepID=A0A1G6MS98_NIADE|nr:glycoside hydrolase family 97 protein [Niabella drilacis]SDC58433.1 alpha-glucosidase [Niabella drilacis]
MKGCFILFLVSFFCAAGNAQKYKLAAPDKKLLAEIENGRQGIRVTLIKEGDSILNLTNLGLITDQTATGPLQVKRIKRNTVNEVIQPLIKEKSDKYHNSYNELVLTFRSRQSLTFRLFNEGMAYRFTTDIQDSLTVFDETLNVEFQTEDSVYFQSERSFNAAYEQPYEFKQLNELDPARLCNLPVLIQKQRGKFVMITESDLYNFPGLWVKSDGASRIRATHARYPRTLVTTDNPYSSGQVGETFDYIARVAGKRTYPWRIFAVADHEEDLISNNMVYLLASPTELKDVSWVRPGVVMFDWWAKNNIFGVDFKAGINTETAKYFIDFCAEKGFRYFLFDDGWSPKNDLLREVPGLDMPAVTAYAKSKGVDVMVWVIWNTLKDQWSEAFDQFERWGIKGIKMDFMNRDDQQMVAFYEAVASKAAEKKMVVDFHGAYKPCGLSRKYPNLLTREALIEFEQSGVSDSDNPRHHNLLPYIRMFTGAMDYIPATMRNANKKNFRHFGDYPMGWGTRAHAMALFIILSSPMTMLPGSPADYRREQECTDFLSKIPVEWDESRLLTGKIGAYTVLARRSGRNWHIGAITNDDPRMIDLSTGFLKPGRYHIEIIEDGVNAVTAATDYKRVRRSFTAGEILKLNLAPGGGWLARITPEQ